MASQPTCSDLHLLLSLDIVDSFPGLWDAVQDISYHGSGTGVSYTAERGPKEIAALALLSSIFKKCEDDINPDATDRCVLGFLTSNAICEEWKLPLEPKPRPRFLVVEGRQVDNPDFRYIPFEDYRRWESYSAVKSCLVDTFSRPTPESLLAIPGFDGSDPFCWDNVFLLADNGPGAAIGAIGGSWTEKFFLSPLTYSNEVLLLEYQKSLVNLPLRKLAEHLRAHSNGAYKVVGGKFDTVIKSFNTDRSIETQPTLNGWAQKGIALIMLHFIAAKYGVRLETQQFINRELARIGSIDGSIATVDEKEASNRIPWLMISDMLSGVEVCNLRDRIAATRVENTLMPWGDYLKLHMCSTMGNSFTFALQTALFLACVEHCHEYHGLTMARQPHIDVAQNLTASDLAERWIEGSYLSPQCVFRKNRVIPDFPLHIELGCLKTLEEVSLPLWGVYGDDIIVPTQCYPTLLYTIQEVLGGTVNVSKSFHTGSFRESCGADWYAGYYVRAVYASSIVTPQDRVSLLNRLILWSAQHNIKLRRICTALWSSLPEKHRVPLSEMETAGLRVPCSLAPKLPKVKRVLEMEKSIQRKCIPYQKWEPQPELLKFSGNQLAIYGPGLLLGMLKGEIVSTWPKHLCGSIEACVWDAYSLGLIQRADGRTTYRTRWEVSCDWDFQLYQSLSKSDIELSLRRNLF